MKKPKPIPTILKTIGLYKNNQAAFVWKNLGRDVQRENGHTYKIFRQVVIKNEKTDQIPPKGVFYVWFETKANPAKTICMSWMTTLFFMGMPGFRSKTWLYDESSKCFGGIYEWDSLEAAYLYQKSFAMGLSKKRSKPGCFTTKVVRHDDPICALHEDVRLSQTDI